MSKEKARTKTVLSVDLPTEKLFPFPVRLTAEQTKLVKAIAKQKDLTVSQVLRAGVTLILQKVASGEVTLGLSE